MPRSHYNPKDSLSVKSDYYAHTYSQRDIDLIRGDLMQRITELTTERDELRDAVLDIRGCEVVMLTPSASPGDLVQKTTYTYVADPQIQRAIEIASKLEPHDD